MRNTMKLVFMVCLLGMMTSCTSMTQGQPDQQSPSHGPELQPHEDFIGVDDHLVASGKKSGLNYTVITEVKDGKLMAKVYLKNSSWKYLHIGNFESNVTLERDDYKVIKGMKFRPDLEHETVGLAYDETVMAIIEIPTEDHDIVYLNIQTGPKARLLSDIRVFDRHNKYGPDSSDDSEKGVLDGIRPPRSESP